MKKTILILLSLVLTLSVYADENDHPVSTITGEGISLVTKGHSIAGRVGDKLIFGDVSTDGHKESHLIMKDDHGVIKTTFSNRESDGAWGGIMINTEKEVDVKLIALDVDSSTYHISVAGKEYKVRVEADDFQNNHFIRPKYILELDGKEISAKMQEGQACYMYSMHLIFMIFGSYLF